MGERGGYREKKTEAEVEAQINLEPSREEGRSFSRRTAYVEKSDSPALQTAASSLAV